MIIEFIDNNFIQLCGRISDKRLGRNTDIDDNLVLIVKWEKPQVVLEWQVGSSTG